ncbi:RHS repeat-associated core domain-containing protein [Streptomyces sp. NBC_00286]|uniref:RHS repeat-associated core domain-containing protein n=1 Tax=Streptomyces sp. NBC_00286 TaxID=2975701 RepID=UPI002E2DCB46|nr:RHS repeat-associated core domain-containing protein [Streptomyces sp. NBC_00286]
MLDLDKDPTPGDPDRVKSLARQLHEFADDVQDALRLVKGMADEDAVLSMVGKTADVFRDEFSGVPKNLKKLKKSYDLAGDALAAYWPKLERAQALADKALVKGREAQADLASAKSRLSTADSWVTRATKEADKYKDDPGSAGKDVPKPDESKVRAATRDATNAKSAQTAAQSDVSAAQSALDAAKKMAADARQMREEAAREAKNKLEEASEAGIQNRAWYEEVGDWVSDNWDTIVAVCKVVVAVLGIIAMIIGGPILGAIVLVAALVVLADTLNKYAKGQASLWDVGLAALDCIPGMKGLTTLGGLAKGLKSAGAMGLKGMTKSLGGLAKSAKGMIADGSKGAYNRLKNVVRSKGSDPVDMATGAMFLPQVDIILPGNLPLTFTRRVASVYRTGWWFGPTWSSTIDQRLEADEDGVIFVTEDGLLLAYPHPVGPDIPVLPETGPRWPLVRMDNGGYRIDDPLTGHARHFAEPADGLALLSRIVDRNDNTITFDYDEYGTPLAIRHSGGYHLQLDVDEGRVTALSLANAAEDGADITIKRYGYTDGNLTDVINSSDLPLKFTYDERLRITSWTDTNNSRYAYTYDEHDRCIAEGGEAGHITVTLEYDGTDPAWPGCRITTLTTAEGAATRFVINDNSQVIAEIDPLGGIQRTDYDAHHHVVSQTNELGHTTRLVLDERGRPTEVVRPDGATMHLEYNHLGGATTIVTPDGACWRREYDEHGNCTSMTDPAGAITRFAYDAGGRVTSVEDTVGNTRTVRCNSAGLPLATTDPLGATTTWERDAFGRIVTYTDPLGHTTRLAWTVEGHLVTRVTSDGAVETWSYDGEGNCTSHTTPTGAITHFEYTHFDLPSARIGPDGSRYEFIHDQNLRLAKVTNPQGLAWTYEHDAAGRLIAECDFDDRVLSYAYDGAGRMIARTNAIGDTTYYEYDVIGDLVRKISGGQVTEFAYDLNRRLVQAAGPDTSVTLEYDLSGFVTRETTNGRRLIYQRDQLGRLTHRTTPSGATTAWTYDAVGNRVQLDASGRTVLFDHDWSGLETSRSIAPSVTLTHAYDGLGRLTAQSLSAPDGNHMLHRAYTYGEDGNLVGTDDQSSGSRRFELDLASRVTAVHAHNWTERYAYDDMGNVAYASWPNGHPGAESTGPRAYTGTRISRAGTTRYEYDALGRIVLRQKKRLSRKPDTWRYTWDSEDRLTSVTTPDETLWRYHYDPLGRRIAKQRIAPDGRTVVEHVDFTWDGFTLCEQTTREESSPHLVTLTWDHDGLRPVAQAERITTPEATQKEIDSRFFSIITDLIGTPTELIDDDGGVVWHTRATLWGTTTWNSDATAYTPLRFPGQYHDPESGLHYNYFRHYDPETARYLTPDPLGLAPAPNPVTYVHNPHTGVDPLGLSPYYSEIAPNGQRGPAYAVVTPQTLDDAANGLIGSSPGRGARHAPPGFQGGAAGHSRGHLIGQQFGGDGRDMRNIVTQGSAQNNGPISDAEDLIAQHVRSTQNTVTMSVTPEYANGGNVPSHILIEAVDDFGWSYSTRLPNM